MLNTFSAVARWLYPFRHVLWVIAALALLGFAALIFTADGSQRDELRTQLPIIALLWSVLLATIAHLFHTTPVPPAPDDGFFERMKKRFRRALAWLLALVSGAVALATIYISVQVVGMFGRAAG